MAIRKKAAPASRGASTRGSDARIKGTAAASARSRAAKPGSASPTPAVPGVRVRAGVKRGAHAHSDVIATAKTKISQRANDSGSHSTVSARAAHDMFERLRAAYPDAHCELDHLGPFQLLVATVLSAQSTDVAVNRITPTLFRRWSDAHSLARAALADVEEAISSLGMFRQKARHLVGLSKALVELHHGEVPRTLEALVALPGVGRKTANVVLGVAFGAPEGVVVDTHVQRLTQRLGWSTHDQPGPIEQDLMQLFPRQHWDALSHTLIFHGRRCCTARAPACAACPVNQNCPSAFQAEHVGRKSRVAR